MTHFKCHENIAQSATFVFDLDGTIIDNRPRVAAIYNELRIILINENLYHADELRELGPADIFYPTLENLRNLGLKDKDIKRGVAYWVKLFFANQLLDKDVAYPAAHHYVNSIAKRGHRIVYLTARPEPDMGEGTLLSLKNLGFPIPDKSQISLWMKPNSQMGDLEYKESTLDHLKNLDVAATFDNEPANCNAFARALTQAQHFHLNTLHSLDAPALLEHIQIINDFDTLLKDLLSPP